MEKVIEKLKKEAGNQPDLKCISNIVIEYIKENPSEAGKVAGKEKTVAGALQAMTNVARKRQTNGKAMLSYEEGFDIIKKYYGFTGTSGESPKTQTVAPTQVPSDSRKLSVDIDDLL